MRGWGREGRRQRAEGRREDKVKVEVEESDNNNNPNPNTKPHTL
jgi:hypothetical protein